MDGKKWSRDCIVSPLDNSSDPSTEECVIGDLGLRSSQRFLYLFDYDDEWTFNVKIEKIDETEPEPMEPFIAQRTGEGPEQYF